MTLLLKPGTSVDVQAATDAEVETLRSTADGLFFQQACVTGAMTVKQDRKGPGVLVLDVGAGISTSGPAPEEWLPADLHTQCEPDVVGANVKGHPVQANVGEAVVHGIQGNAIFQVIVAADGSVEKLRLLKSLDEKHGADRAAEKAIRATTFEPATKAGLPVRFMMLYVFQLLPPR